MRDDETPGPEDEVDDEAGPGVGGPRFGPVGGASGNQEVLRGALPVAPEVEIVEPKWEERDEWALPERYGTDVVVALVRDPWWVFVYWEVDPAVRAAAKARAGQGGRFVLRVLDTGAGNPVLAQVRVPDRTSGDWYVQVKAPRLEVKAVLGYLSRDGSFHSVFESLPAAVPAFEPWFEAGEMPAPGAPAEAAARRHDLMAASVAGLPTGPEVETRVREREAVAGRRDDELGPFVWSRAEELSGVGLGMGFKVRPPHPTTGEGRPAPSSPTGPWRSGEPRKPGGENP